MITKIITHVGTFHADEISGVALLLCLFPGVPVERTYTPSEADFADPSVIVVDIGRRYEPHLSNFDHHQSSELPAANMLLLRHFFSPEKPRLGELLEKHFFGYISDVDIGLVTEGEATPPTINGIIRCCNNIPEKGFLTALGIMSAALEANIETAKRRIASEDIWKNVQIYGGVAVYDSPDFIVGWHELALESGVNYLVSQNLRGGYRVESRESKEFPIPADSRQTFLHNSGFMAAYLTLQDATEHAFSFAEIPASAKKK